MCGGGGGVRGWRLVKRGCLVGNRLGATDVDGAGNR